MNKNEALRQIQKNIYHMSQLTNLFDIMQHVNNTLENQDEKKTERKYHEIIYLNKQFFQPYIEIKVLLNDFYNQLYEEIYGEEKEAI